MRKMNKSIVQTDSRCAGEKYEYIYLFIYDEQDNRREEFRKIVR